MLNSYIPKDPLKVELYATRREYLNGQLYVYI